MAGMDKEPTILTAAPFQKIGYFIFLLPILHVKQMPESTFRKALSSTHLLIILNALMENLLMPFPPMFAQKRKFLVN